MEIPTDSTNDPFPRRIALTAAKGNFFPNKTRPTQVRARSDEEMKVIAIQAELQRIGAWTRKLSVRTFNKISYLNIFGLRGLDPDLAWNELRHVPAGSGQQAALRALSQLEQRVVRL